MYGRRSGRGYFNTHHRLAPDTHCGCQIDPFVVRPLRVVPAEFVFNATVVASTPVDHAPAVPFERRSSVIEVTEFEHVTVVKWLLINAQDGPFVDRSRRGSDGGIVGCWRGPVKSNVLLLCG